MSVKCIECQGERPGYKVGFCSNECRRVFNNRRLQRGAILYDLLMAQRLDKDVAEHYGFEARLEAIIVRWAIEDEKAQRKRTWKHPQDTYYDTAGLVRP